MNWTRLGDRMAGRPSAWASAVVAVLAFALPQPLQAQEPTEAGSGTTLYAVGATGVECAKAPCPVRGIWVAEIPKGSLAEIRKALHFADHDGTVGLPNLRGPSDHRKAVQEAWNADECLIVEGDFGPDEKTGIPRLRIDRIVGPCE